MLLIENSFHAMLQVGNIETLAAAFTRLREFGLNADVIALLTNARFTTGQLSGADHLMAATLATGIRKDR